MFRNSALAVIFILSSGAANAQADPEPEEEIGPWSGDASLGFLSTSGNTETTSYNAAFSIAYTKNKWKHEFSAAANGADESEITTAESYQAGWRSAYNWNEHNYLFGLIDWRKDRFSGVPEQLSETLGYGRRLINTPAHALNAELGAGHRSSDLSDGTSESGVIGRGALAYIWTFTETSNFQQDLIVEAGSDNTYVESVSAVRARLMGEFAMVLSYTVRHNTDVPAGSQNTDKLTAIALEYAF